MYTVAIVGRPNVGKSTLFNRLSRSRRALVGNEPGMTRDRIFRTVDWGGKRFELVDTGGIVPDDGETIHEKVFEQAAVAIDQADLTLLVVDGRAGVTPLDREVNKLLQARGKDYFLVVNKIDVAPLEAEAYEFYQLGVSRLFPISAEHALGIDALLEEVTGEIPAGTETADPDEIRVAIIGRPNVGKSSLINRLLGEERVIVSEAPGTTRDAVDTLLRHHDTQFRLIDTAGIRRKGRTSLKAEKLSVVMARKNIEQADVVVLLIDAVEGATKLDATIGGYASEAGRSVIVIVNKWDLVEKDTHTAHQLEVEFRRRMRFLFYAPMVFVSALTGLRVFKVLELVAKASEHSRIRVSTPELNQFFQKEVGPLLYSPGSSRKFPLKFACQVGVQPPTFVLFLRGVKKLHFSMVRRLSNRLRDRFEFFATPIRILQRPASKLKKGRGFSS